MNRKRVKQLVRKVNTRLNRDTFPIGTKLHAVAKLTQSFLRTPTRIVADFINNIPRFRKARLKLISQRPQHASRKTPVTSTTLNDRQLVIQLNYVARKRCGKQLTALGTGAIVAFPAPAFPIRALIVAAARIVQRRLHPIVKSNTPFTSNQFP